MATRLSRLSISVATHTHEKNTNRTSTGVLKKRPPDRFYHVANEGPCLLK
ncbi:protein of unknown function [Mesotoga infera]|uniref:Uncharacterized protein n=1 Tax=Mesotoga infera TaxID=1236046 RepID=A0A7Z7LIJ8_9BACT|nr:protein of unknown function [Mesotoga infera]